MTGFEAFVVVWLAGIAGAGIAAYFVDRWRARVWARRTTTRIAQVRREIARLDALDRIDYSRRWR